MPHTHQEGKRLIFTLLRPGGESRAGLSNRSEIAFKSDKRKVAWTWIVFNGWAKVRSLTQYRLAALSCSVSTEEEHAVFLITSHMYEVERYEQGIRHKSHHHSTFKHGVRLTYNSHQCLTKWLNCDMFYLIAFEFIDVCLDGALWLRPESSQGSEGSPASVPSLKHDHCMGAELVSTSFWLVSGMKSSPTNQNISGI